MLILKPICHTTIWGDERLAEFAGEKLSNIGHLYSVFCNQEQSNWILNGPAKGKTLNETFNTWKNDAGMSKYEYFPLRIALTSAKENLSIQVHPDDCVANEMEHLPHGKRESWLFLETPSCGWIINGCTCLDKGKIQDLIEQDRLLEAIEQLQVKKGDYVYIPPGTLHALTAGSLVYEIEEGPDITYRFYDYDRVDSNGKTRELQVEKALIALDVTRKVVPKNLSQGKEISEETYTVKKIGNSSSYVNKSEELECLTIIDGSFYCENTKIMPGMTLLLFPGEQLQNANILLAVVSKLRRK